MLIVGLEVTSGRKFHFGEKKCLRIPKSEIVEKLFLAFDVWADDADALANFLGEPCCQKWLGRRGYPTSDRHGFPANNLAGPLLGRGTGITSGEKLVAHGVIFWRRQVVRKARPTGPELIFW